MSKLSDKLAETATVVRMIVGYNQPQITKREAADDPERVAAMIETALHTIQFRMVHEGDDFALPMWVNGEWLATLMQVEIGAMVESRRNGALVGSQYLRAV